MHADVLTVIPFAAFDIQEHATAPLESLREGHHDSTAPARLAAGRDRDRGSMTTELVVLAPIVIVLLLLVVGLGRYAHGKQLVEQAAAAAARAASLTSTAAPSAAAEPTQAAAGSLADAGVSCTGMTTDVDTGSFRPGGMVTVTITCTADLSDLAMSGLPGTATFTATGRAPLEDATVSSPIPETSHDPATGPGWAAARRDHPPLDPAPATIGIADRSPPTC